MNFYKKREQAKLERQSEMTTLQDKEKAAEGFQMLQDAESKIERASNAKEVEAIIHSTRERLRQLFKKGEEHDYSRFHSLLVDLFEDGVEWVESKKSD